MEYKLDNLQVYTMAESFSNKIWVIVSGWDHFQKDTLGKQMVRSADSISANIAEGYGRHFFNESKQFYFYSRGSITETQSWLQKSKARNLITESQFNELISDLDTIHAKLNGYIKWIKNAKNSSSKPY